jgi:hypothetical protein
MQNMNKSVIVRLCIYFTTGIEFNSYGTVHETAQRLTPGDCACVDICTSQTGGYVYAKHFLNSYFLFGKPASPPEDISRWINMGHCWYDDTRKRTYSGSKHCRSVTLSTSNLTWTGLKKNPRPRGVKLAINCLCQATATFPSTLDTINTIYLFIYHFWNPVVPTRLVYTHNWLVPSQTH